MIAKSLLKLLTKITSIEDLDFLSLEPSLILPPLFQKISPDFFSEQIENVDLKWSFGLQILDKFLEENISSVLEYNLDALKQNDETMVIEVICQILAILSIFNLKEYTFYLNELGVEEKKNINSIINPFENRLRKEITEIYVGFSLKDRGYLTRLIDELEKCEEEINNKDDIIKKLQINKESVEHQFQSLMNQIEKKDEDLNANDYIKNELLNNLESNKEMIKILKEENEKLDHKLKKEEDNGYKLEAELGKLTNELNEYKKRIDNFIDQERFYKNKEKIYEENLNQLALYEEKAKNYDNSVKNIQDLKTFITILHGNNKKLQDQIKEQIDERNQLASNKKKLEKMNLQQTARLNILETELNELKKEKIIYKNHYKNLETQYFSDADRQKEGEKEEKEKIEKNNILYKKIKSLENEIGNLNEQLIAKQTSEDNEEINNLINQIETMEIDKNKMKNDLETKDKENEDLIERIEMLSKNTGGRRGSDNNVFSKLKELEKKLNVKEDQIDFLNKNNEELQSMLNRKKSVTNKNFGIEKEKETESKSENKFEEKNNDLENMDLENMTNKEELDNIIRASHKKLKEYQNDREDLVKELAQKKNTLKELQNLLHDSENKTVYLNQDKLELEKEIEELKLKNKNLRNDIRKLKNKVNNDNEEVKDNEEIKENVDFKTEDNFDFKVEKEELEEKINKLEKKQDLMKDDFKKILEENKVLKIEKEDLDDKIETVEKEKSKLENNLNDLKEDINIIEDKRKNMIQKYNSLIIENKDLKKDVIKSNKKADSDNETKILQENYKKILNDNNSIKLNQRNLEKKINFFETEKKRDEDENVKLEKKLQNIKIENEEMRLKYQKLKRSKKEQIENFKEKIVYKTEEKIIEKFVPIAQKEFEYQNNQLFYSVFMGYYKDYLKIDDMVVKRNRDVKSKLTNRFSLGKLLND